MNEAIGRDSAATACCDSCATASNSETIIACSLNASDFKGRIAGVRSLASRALVRADRQSPLRLRLVYAATALAEVEELAANESQCCSFLDFALSHDTAGVYLAITAPIEALDVADQLFAWFAPDAPGAAT